MSVKVTSCTAHYSCTVIIISDIILCNSGVVTYTHACRCVYNMYGYHIFCLGLVETTNNLILQCTGIVHKLTERRKIMSTVMYALRATSKIR